MTTATGGNAQVSNRSNQERIQDEIKSFILQEHLHPGDPLPTESDLMARLGVSRNPLREAIKALQALGFVEVRHGHGTYVGALPLRPLQDFLSFRLQRSIAADLRDVAELLQVREALEVGLASDVIRTYNRRETGELTEIVERMKSRADAGEYFPEEDLAFHQALYAPMENSLVDELLEVFWTVFHVVDPDLPGPHYTPADAWGWHAQLLRAIETGDTDLYRMRMREHFDGIRIRISMASVEEG
jgi:DNA-binding FadR family transcriptional regulator